LRLAFFGTPGFAAPTLARLLGGAHSVVAVVTQPERPRGRGRRSAPLPVAALAAEAGVPLLQPERAGGAENLKALEALRPDLGVVVAFGQFLPKPLRELPSCGYCINAHASLLPRQRGAAPIPHAILAGDAETGVSIMRVAREMDAGPLMFAERDGRSRFRTSIAKCDDAASLGARLAALAAEATACAVDAIAAGNATWTGQDHAAATLAPKIGPADAQLDFRESAEALARRVRALSPRPGAQARIGALHLRILAARAEEPRAGESTAPGTLHCGDGALRAATGAGWLRLLRLQRAGGRALAAEDFLRGQRIPAGARFAAP